DDEDPDNGAKEAGPESAATRTSHGQHVVITEGVFPTLPCHGSGLPRPSIRSPCWIDSCCARWSAGLLFSTRTNRASRGDAITPRLARGRGSGVRFDKPRATRSMTRAARGAHCESAPDSFQAESKFLRPARAKSSVIIPMGHDVPATGRLGAPPAPGRARGFFSLGRKAVDDISAAVPGLGGQRPVLPRRYRRRGRNEEYD